MNVLITGCAGLIGSNLCNWLLDNIENITIIGVDNLSGGYKVNIPLSVKFYEIDLCDYKSVNEIFTNHNIEYIFHFAAYAAECLSPFIRTYNYSNNLLATTNLVNMAIKHKIKRFVFTSSMAVYGKGDGKLPYTEETPKNPVDPYGVAKLSCEMDLKIASEQHGIEYCIIRPHNVYGVNQNIWDRYRNVLGIWMYQIINGEDITIYGDGEQVRAFTYVDDILQPLWNAAVYEKAKNQEINLGGIHEISINNVAKMVLDQCDDNPFYNTQIKYLESRHEIKKAWCSYKKSIDLLDFKMNTTLYHGIRKMWRWVLKQPKRDRHKWSEFEIDDKIYSYWK